MGGGLLLAFLGVALFYYASQSKGQGKQRIVDAVQEEIISEFPEYAAVVSQGAAARIANEMLNKNGLYRDWGRINARLLKQSDFMKNKGNLNEYGLFDPKLLCSGLLCETTVVLVREWEVAFKRFIAYFKAQLPTPLEEHINSLPLETQASLIIDITSRVEARF